MSGYQSTVNHNLFHLDLWPASVVLEKSIINK